MDNFVINASIHQNANPCEGVISWISGTPPASNFARIVWADTLNLFVALQPLSGANVVITSPDGITWTQRTVPTTGTPFWSDIAWSHSLGLLVAVAASGTNRVMTSPDAITWTQRSASNASKWWRVKWIPGLNLFVAGADNWGVNVNVMTSANGINWTTRNSAAFAARAITWSPELSLIVIACSASPFVITSPDGISWTTRTVSGTPQFTGVDWSASLGLFVATSTSTTILFARSSDGVNWTTYNAGYAPAADDMNDIAWAPEISTFVAVGLKAAAPAKVVFSSKDGISWTERTAPNTTATWVGITWSPELGRFCAVGLVAPNNSMVSSPCP